MKAHIQTTCPCALSWQPGAHLPALETLCREAGLVLKVMTEADLDLCVGELCGLPGSYPKNSLPHGSNYPEALVMHGLSDPELNRLLTALREARLSIPLKAIVTPTSSQWPLFALLQELCEEHIALSSREKK